MRSKRNAVLIVDDCRENLSALRAILEETYTVYIATSGENALRLIDRNPPDIVLLDVVMPGIDGFEVLKRIRRDRSRNYIPVIFVTSNDDRFSESKGLLLGAADYITKPYNPDIITLKIKNQLENKMYRDDLEYLVQKRTEELRSSQEAIIFCMSMMAERRDLETGSHLKRIQKYTGILADYIHTRYPSELSEREMADVVAYAPLHDIGKISVSDSILLKPSQLLDDEFDTMKQHTVIGADIIGQTRGLLKAETRDLVTAMNIAIGHHEKFDGSGYPCGLKGADIPISARIVTLADVYDALISNRPYKRAFTPEVARETILRGDGRTEPEHFDPMVLEAFKATEHLFSGVVCDFNEDLQVDETEC